ncbi:sporulation protein YunB [Massilibacterium senegalense]|uniref:sporulation protein YunB n=1 Tax=Massilibacterium senegalense TaxID=1632858 RepID=UPI000A7E8D67|nr:sporulation protein YunB [Massilibacterium senegalense]
MWRRRRIIWKNKRKRRRTPLPFRYVFVTAILLFVLITWQSMVYIENAIRPTLLTIAENETERIAGHAINDAITKRIIDEEEMSELVMIEKSADGKITSIGFDPVISNKVLSKATTRVQNYLQKIEDGEMDDLGSIDGIKIEVDKNKQKQPGIVHMIPLGQATNNVLLANLGPKIPVHFTMIGDAQSEMNKTIKEVGINNALIELSINITVKVKVIIPFASKTSEVSSNIVIATQYVQGEVPQYYHSGGSSDFSRPSVPPPKEEK